MSRRTEMVQQSILDNICELEIAASIASEEFIFADNEQAAPLGKLLHGFIRELRTEQEAAACRGLTWNSIGRIACAAEVGR